MTQCRPSPHTAAALMSPHQTQLLHQCNQTRPRTSTTPRATGAQVAPAPVTVVNTPRRHHCGTLHRHHCGHQWHQPADRHCTDGCGAPTRRELSAPMTGHTRLPPPPAGGREGGGNTCAVRGGGEAMFVPVVVPHHPQANWETNTCCRVRP